MIDLRSNPDSDDNIKVSLPKNSQDEDPGKYFEPFNIMCTIEGIDPTGVDIKKTSVRWCMLLMACNFLVGSYFCYDNPGPLET